MPIIKEVKKPCRCCDKPDPSLYGIGTIWQCDACSAQFELCSDWRDGSYWSKKSS